MRFSGQISDFAIRSWLIHRTRLTALHFRSTGDTHLQLLPHTPSRADQRFASLWPSRGAPQQRTCLIGVEFPLPGPQVWTFTSCSLLMPDTLLRRSPAAPGSPFTSRRRLPQPHRQRAQWRGERRAQLGRQDQDDRRSAERRKGGAGCPSLNISRKRVGDPAHRDVVIGI